MRTIEVPRAACRGPMMAALCWLIGGAVEEAEAVPMFARAYGVECAQCHVSPPKLNAFGEMFAAHGYRAPSLEPKRRTWPFAIWLSGRSDDLPGRQATDRHRGYVNRLELISGGSPASWLTYFVEWRPVSLESRSDGSLRDRSGRFEDLYLVLSRGPGELTVGQFRQVSQVDVSRRLGLAEPLVLSASLPGSGTGSARERSLRGFAPAGRSPAIRGAWVRESSAGWRWQVAAALPVPGELSLPLNEEAENEASNEIEWRRKGLVLETYARRGLQSWGAHAFVDHDRSVVQAVATGSAAAFQWTAIGGAARVADLSRGQWSLEGEWVPHRFWGVGARVEDRAADGAKAALLPYLNAHVPGSRYTVRLTVEQRFQEDRNSTLAELGLVF